MIYYYIDEHGIKQGCRSHYKIARMAEQFSITETFKCPDEEFIGSDCFLHNEEYRG